MYIYIEGKEPVARKSKSLAEMGVKDGDNLIVTTEMKLPFNEESDEPSMDGPGMMHHTLPGIEEQFDLGGQVNNHQVQQNQAHLTQFQDRSGQRNPAMGMSLP